MKLKESRDGTVWVKKREVDYVTIRGNCIKWPFPDEDIPPEVDELRKSCLI